MATTPTTTQNYNYNPASAGGIVSTDTAKIADTVKAMQQQAVGSATPVAKSAETARMQGNLNPQQAESLKTLEYQAANEPNKPPSPEVVSTAQAALKDLYAKKGYLDQTLAGIVAQAQAKQAVTQAPPAPTEGAPTEGQASADLLKQLGIEPEVPATTEPQTLIEKQQAQVAEGNKQLDTLSANLQADIASLRNGTFPLTPTQQAVVDSTLAAAQRAVAQQKIANANYTGAVRAAGISSGRARYAPEIAAGDIQASISTGIAKIQDIEMKAQESVAKLKEGFEERNYKLINDEYTMLIGLQKEKNNALNDLGKTMIEHENKMRQYNLDIVKEKNEAERFKIQQNLLRDKFDYDKNKDAIDQAVNERRITLDEAKELHDYNYKLRSLEQGNYIITTDASNNPVAFNKKTGQFETKVLPVIPGETPLEQNKNSAFIDAFNNVGPSSTPERKVRLGQLNGLIAKGDYQRAKEMLTELAIEKMPAADQKQAVARTVAIDQIDHIKSLINAYVTKSGDTNILKGTMQDIANKVGASGDPDLAAMGSEMKTILINYRRDMTGLAFGETEAKEYSKILADYHNIEELNGTLLNTFLGTLTRQQKSLLSSKIGGSNYDAIFPPVPLATRDDLIRWGEDNPQQKLFIQQQAQKYNWSPEQVIRFVNQNFITSKAPQTFSSVGGDTNKATGMTKLMNSIGMYESGGDYNAKGKVLASGNYVGDRAYGKYQIMGRNIPSWTKEALGYSMTPQEFLANKSAQDKVAKYKMQQFYDKYGTPEDVASMWLSGKPATDNVAKDLATGISVPQYIQGVMSYYNG